MLTKIIHAAVGSEILHFGRITFSKEKFQKLITTLLTRMRRHILYQDIQLKRLLNKPFGKHFGTYKILNLYTAKSLT